MRVSPQFDAMGDTTCDVTVFVVFMSKPVLLYCAEDTAGVTVVWRQRTFESPVEEEEVLYWCAGKIWMGSVPYQKEPIALFRHENSSRAL